MIKAGSELRQRCYNHPHRRGTRQCFRCRRGMCDQCALEQSGQTICEHCQEELVALDELTHIPVKERVRRAGVGVRNWTIGLGILAVLAIPGYFVVKNLMSTPITPEEFARFRYAASGSFETPEGVMVLSTVLGGKVVSATSEQPEFPARRLIDEYYGSGFGGWRSADAAFPQEVVIQTSQPTRVEKVLLVNQPGEPPETGVREFEVLVSTESPDGPFRSIGRWTLQQGEEPQRFQFDAVPAAWVKVRVLSNYGGPYTSLAEFDAYLLPQGPFGAQTPVVPAKP